MATLKDVAKEAGLTVTTVSRVLNNRGYISEDAKRKVDEAMKKLNYQPNELARSLHRKNSNIIGLIVPHISHPYFAEVISGVEKYASQNGYHVLLCNTQGINGNVEEYIGQCIRNRVAGIILSSGVVESNLLSKLDIPVICLERHMDSCTACVECDNFQGGSLAAKTLIDAGCKHLAYLGSISTNDMPADQRYNGFDKVCKEMHVPYEFFGANDETFQLMDYRQLCESILLSKVKVDGVFATSDVIGAQLLQTCYKHNVSVPEDLKIVGFDDVNISSLTTPQLTTIHQPIEEMTETAVELLKKAVEGKLVPRKSVLPVELIKRDTI